MKRLNVLATALGFGLVYIIIQTYLAGSFMKYQQRVQSSVEQSEDGPHWVAADHVLMNTKEVTAEFAKSKIDVFLIDPNILEGILKVKRSHDDSPGQCRFLCASERHTWFGFHGDGIRGYHGTSIGIKLQTKGFKIREIYSYKVGMLSHVLVHRYRHTIYLTVFHGRGDFLWHSSIHRKTVTSLPWQQVSLPYLEHEGAFDWFQVVPVTMDSVDLLTPRYPNAFLAQLNYSKFVECNTTRAKMFYSEYPKDESQVAKEFQSKALTVLRKAKQILDDLKVRFWLSSGTCLGWYRQCDIITYSQDVDLGIWIKDYNPKILPTFKLDGFQLDHLFGKVSDSFQLSFRYNLTKLDMFFFYEESDYMWNGGTQDTTAKKFKYIFPKFTLCWTDFFRMKVRVPCETESYVVANYGRNWFEPIKHWDWKESPSNVRPNGEWPEEDWDDVIQMF